MTELTTALQNSNSGRSPGLDGLTYESCKKFWNELGPLLLGVANTSMQEEKLPNSMLNGIITLTPKKGELILLSNWRPITLLNTDYKLITRCLARRIISVLPDLITADQSYCIPNRSIHTNLHLMRGSIDYANQHDLPLAVISLDEASAYDCVEHPYILHVLDKFGFGKTFIQNMRTVYRNAQGLVNITARSRRPSNMREEYDKETLSLGHCSPSPLKLFYYSATIIFEIMDLKYHPPSAEYWSPANMQTISQYSSPKMKDFHCCCKISWFMVPYQEPH
jgi:hypothetical protein